MHTPREMAATTKATPREEPSSGERVGGRRTVL
jgi:hypothetical protein